MLFAKLAILVQLKRMFRGTKRDSVYWLTIIQMVLHTVYYIAAGIIILASCSPREKIWKPTVPGTCLDNNINIIAGGALNFVLDFLIFLLPVYAIFRLKIAIKRKLVICAIFAIGLL